MESTETTKKQGQKAKTHTVLIADDDSPTRILLRAAITQWGYNILEAKDGEEAWQLLQQFNTPVLLIVDWLMPRVDGIALCERIKAQLPYHPYTILLTQVSGTTNIIKGLEAGADEFLSKPFNMAELRSRLSVGERIINYEEKLAEQKQEFQECTSQLETLTTLMKDLADKIENMNLSMESKKNISQVQKEIHNNLEMIMKIINDVQLNAKKKEAK